MVKKGLFGVFKAKHTPFFTFSVALEVSRLPEEKNSTKGKACLDIHYEQMSIPWTKQIWPLLGAREYTSNGASIFRANCRILHRFFTTKSFVIVFPVDVVLFKFIIHLFNLILSLPVRWFPGDYRISLCECIKKRIWHGIRFLLLQDSELKLLRFLFLTPTTKIWWKSVLKLKYLGFWGFATHLSFGMFQICSEKPPRRFDCIWARPPRPRYRWPIRS